MTNPKHDGKGVSFPPGTTFEVTLSDDASLENDTDEHETLRDMALRGWRAMLQYVSANGHTHFTVRATTYTRQSDGRLGEPRQVDEHDVVIDNDTLMEILCADLNLISP